MARKPKIFDVDKFYATYYKSEPTTKMFDDKRKFSEYVIRESKKINNALKNNQNIGIW